MRRKASLFIVSKELLGFVDTQKIQSVQIHKVLKNEEYLQEVLQKGKISAIFKMKEDSRIKMTTLLPTIIRNPEKNKNETKRIKDVTVKYCTKLLTNRAPRQGLSQVLLGAD